MEKILITGASGFIGKNLISYLKEKGHQLKILLRKERDLNYFKNFGKVFLGDLSLPKSLKGILKDVKSVIHCAGAVRGNSYEDFYFGNVKTTENLIKEIKEEGNIKKFIFLSSLSAFGPSNQGEIPKEEDPAKPISFYGKSKLEAEELLKEKLGYPLIILRLPAVYGPYDKEIHRFFKDAHRGTLIIPFKKNQKIQLIYVKDVNIAIELSLLKDVEGTFFIAHPEILNIMEISFFLKEIIGKPVSIYNIPESLVKFFSYINLYFCNFFGKKTMYNPQKTKEILASNWVCSTEKAKKILNFDAKYNFLEGAKETYKWYKENNWI